MHNSPVAFQTAVPYAPGLFDDNLGHYKPLTGRISKVEMEIARGHNEYLHPSNQASEGLPF